MTQSDLATNKNIGFFVAFEGIDGSGKTTLIAQVFKNLEASGLIALKTREPGGTLAGQAIRNLLQHATVELSPLAEAFLFAADRTEHISTIVKPAKQRGAVVLSDRSYISSLVYQTEKTLSLQIIEEINKIALQGCYPDLVVYVDLDPEQARKRFMQRPETQTRFEARGLSFFKNVYARYADIIKTLPNVLVIDGMLATEKAAQLVAEKISADLTR